MIRLDLSMVKTDDVEVLREQLSQILERYERKYGRSAGTAIGGRLQYLIERVHETTGSKVVVLVDEYDAPLLNVLDDTDVLERFRMVMREFFIPLKACDEHLRFVFLTGITKFGQLPIFSELNNLRDISMNPEYAGICGITEDELEGSLAPDVSALADRLGLSQDETLDRLRGYYDGYRFCGGSPGVYNPFSLMSCFAEGALRSYWFGSGTPAHLIKAIQHERWGMPDLGGGVQVLESEFDVPTERAAAPIALLYQSGYLTIKSYDKESHVYTLGIPNREVSRGLRCSL